MKLRGRLLVRSLGQATIVALSIFIVGDYFRTGDMEQTLRREVTNQMISGARERCEANPSRFGQAGPPPFRGGRPTGPPPDRAGDGPPGRRGGPPPGGGGPNELFAYARDFTPADPHAPEFPSALRASLLKGEDVSTRFWTAEGRGVAIAAPLGDPAGPCAYLLARMLPRRGVLFDSLLAVALVLVVMLVAGWAAMGPVVARLGKLASGVRRSAASHYEQPVEVSSAGDEIDDLAGAFNSAGVEVRQHLLDISSKRDALRRFVANTTHDVALPLTVLQGHLAELERTHGSEAVREAMQEAHYMASLLRNLGAAAKLDEDASTLQRHAVDLNALVERVVARHRALARSRGVVIDFAVPDPPITIQSDITLLEQSVSNLVDNAIQYNHAGGHCAIVLDRTTGETFRLSVVDDGPGLSEEEVKAMTARQVRGSDARTRRPEGQGLGLAIVTEATGRLGLQLNFRRPVDGGLAVEISGSARDR